MAFGLIRQADLGDLSAGINFSFLMTNALVFLRRFCSLIALLPYAKRFSGFFKESWARTSIRSLPILGSAKEVYFWSLGCQKSRCRASFGFFSEELQQLILVTCGGFSINESRLSSTGKEDKSISALRLVKPNLIVWSRFWGVRTIIADLQSKVLRLRISASVSSFRQPR